MNSQTVQCPDTEKTSKQTKQQQQKERSSSLEFLESRLSKLFHHLSRFTRRGSFSTLVLHGKLRRESEKDENKWDLINRELSLPLLPTSRMRHVPGLYVWWRPPFPASLVPGRCALETALCQPCWFMCLLVEDAMRCSFIPLQEQWKQGAQGGQVTHPRVRWGS